VLPWRYDVEMGTAKLVTRFGLFGKYNETFVLSTKSNNTKGLEFKSWASKPHMVLQTLLLHLRKYTVAIPF